MVFVMPFIKSKSIFSSNNSNTIDDSNLFPSNSSNCESPARNTFFRLGYNNNIESDPAIRRARKKVVDAEKMGKEADIALVEARNRVREAKEHVQALEQEILDSAKAKRTQSKTVSKNAKGFGRRGQ